ncbi:MAG TPA: DUF6351 family protein [Vicinamibacterales bacterium]|nr:DUF6351 family protein [Vicinamibacterales bacterium]
MKRIAVIGFVAVVGILAAPVAAQQKAAGPAASTPAGAGLEIRALSTRAELVSGGDVLLQIAGPANLTAKNLTVRVNGNDASAAFKVAPDKTFVGLVTGLNVGSNTVQAAMRGSKAAVQLTVINHPIAGPVLYSPHQTPFICETQASGLGEPLDADCSASTKVEYFYRSTAAAAPRENQGGDLAAADNANGFGGGRGNAAANPFKPLDPNAPRPADIAMTTTTDGKTVPYIVRREMGTINRAVYSIAFLHEPGTPLPSPWTAGAAWNGRLVYTFGGGVAWGYHQGRTIGGLNGNRGNLEDGQYGDFPVAKGFALAGSSLNVFGTYANDVVSAETMMMVKEHFIEQFGPIKWTIGSGRSGGSMQQHLIANNYPGLLDAIVPTASFADVITFQTSLLDCELLDRAMTVSKQPFTTDQKTAVSGFSHWDYCTNNKLRYAAVAADINCDPQTVPPSMRFDPARKPDGVRCTYQDAYVSVYGKDPKTGFARRPFDNAGVQYGLAAFNAGKINFNQFLDINRLAGGHDINGNLVAERTVADREALRIAYETGRVNDGAHGLALIPIIDMRPYTEGPGGNVHDTFDGVIAGNRIDAAGGGNRISRVYDERVPVVRAQDANLEILDAWLAAVASDTAPGSPREKVLRNKPAGLADSCFTAQSEEIKDPARCKAMFPVYANPRIVAGAPMTDDVFKCELKSIDKADYARPVTDAQLAALRAVFPQGVCDYGKKGVLQRPLQGTWQAYPTSPAATTK